MEKIDGIEVIPEEQTGMQDVASSSTCIIYSSGLAQPAVFLTDEQLKHYQDQFYPKNDPWEWVAWLGRIWHRLWTWIKK